MSKIYIYLMNGPAGSGKDAITEKIKDLYSSNPNQKILNLSFKDALFEQTANFFNMDISNFYNTNIGGMYDRDNKELPNKLFNIKDYINNAMVQKFYKELNGKMEISEKPIQFSEKNFNEFKEKYKIKDEFLSPRQALIFVSENIIKPNYGNTFFGKIIADKIKNIYLENQLNKKDIGIYITDGGFVHELIDLHNLSQTNNKIIPMICSIYRDGKEFDPKNDSRTRMTTEELLQNGINIPIIKVENNKTLDEVAKETVSLIENFKEELNPNIAQVALTARIDGGVNYLKELTKLMETFNHSKYLINDINISKNKIFINIINENGKPLNKTNSKEINSLIDRMQTNNLSIIKKINYIKEPNLKINTFKSQKNLKNYLATSNFLDKNGSLEEINKNLKSFLFFKPKTESLFLVFNKLLEKQLESVSSEDIKSFQTLVKNISKENEFGNSGVNKDKFINLRFETPEDLLETIQKLQLELLLKENGIKTTNTGCYFDLLIKDYPLNVVDGNFIKFTENYDFNKIEPLTLDKSLFDDQITSSGNNFELFDQMVTLKINEYKKNPTLENAMNVTLFTFDFEQKNKYLNTIINSLNKISEDGRNLEKNHKKEDIGMSIN